MLLTLKEFSYDAAENKRVIIYGFSSQPFSENEIIDVREMESQMLRFLAAPLSGDYMSEHPGMIEKGYMKAYIGMPKKNCMEITLICEPKVISNIPRTLNMEM